MQAGTCPGEEEGGACINGSPCQSRALEQAPAQPVMIPQPQRVQQEALFWYKPCSTLLPMWLLLHLCSRQGGKRTRLVMSALL